MAVLFSLKNLRKEPDIVRFLNRGKTDSCPTSSKGYRS